MIFLRSTFLLILFFCNYSLFAEDAEEIFLSVDEEAEHYSELSDNLDILRKHPLNVNTASFEDLRELPWLSRQNIIAIIESRKKRKLGQFSDLEKIGIDQVIISEIKSYIIFDAPEKLHFDQMLRCEYNEKNNDVPSSLKYYHRSMFQIGNYDFGFLSQKDEFERNPFDYYSYFLTHKGNKFIKKLILGKYQLTLGQGILFASKLGMSKTGATTRSPQKHSQSLRKYKSSYEIWDLEGGAMQLKYGNIYFLPFYSNTKLSANLESNKITSFNTSGVHYDQSEIDNVKEIIYGAQFEYQFGHNELAINSARIGFDHDFDDPVHQQNYTISSFNFLFFPKDIPIFGEIAFSNQKVCGLTGFKVGNSQFKQLFLLRYYPKNFPTWHGNPFSSQSNFDNELGLYYGLKFKPIPRTRVNIYFDVWKHPDARYFEKMPTSASDEFIQIQHKFDRNTIRLTLKNKHKEKYISLDESMIRNFQRTTYRADFWQNISNVRFKTRFEINTEYLKDEAVWKKGFLTYQQLKIKFKNLECITQITLYHSDVLHYMYENNVDGIMQNSVLRGDGIYSFLLMKYNFFKHYEVQCKISDHWQKKNKMKLYLQIITQF